MGSWSKGDTYMGSWSKGDTHMGSWSKGDTHMSHGVRVIHESWSKGGITLTPCDT